MHIKMSDQNSLDLGYNDYTCNWGAHICALYRNQAERDAIVYGFLGRGLKDGDICLYGKDDAAKEDVLAKMSGLCPSCAVRVNDPLHFQAIPAKALYYPDGEFSPWAMEDRLEKFFAFSQKDGPRNIRVTGEMSWALDMDNLDLLMAYESRFNYFIQDKPWIGICLYNVERFNGKTILNALQTHPYTLSSGVIIRNPYYQDPDTWLSANAPQFLTRAAHAR